MAEQAGVSETTGWGRPPVENLRVGRLAEFAGWMSPEQLGECLHRQRLVAREGLDPPKLVQLALERRFLSDPQAEALLRIQTLHRPAADSFAFGEMAASWGLVPRDDVDACLAEQKRLLQETETAPMLGELFEQRGLLNGDQVRGIVDAQAAHGRGILIDLRSLAVRRDETEADGSAHQEDARAEDAEALAAVTTVEEAPALAGAPTFVTPDLRKGRRIEEVQGAQDLRLGRLAYYAGFLSAEQLVACLARKKDAIDRQGVVPKLGKIAVEEGLLTEAQVENLLRFQSIHQPTPDEHSFGATAVGKGFVTKQQLEECLSEQGRLLEKSGRAPRLGILMAEKRLLNNEQVKSILQSQAAEGKGPLAELESVGATEPPHPLPGETKQESGPVAAAFAGTLVCRCEVCGEQQVLGEWTPRKRCPSCHADAFAPVPVEDEAIGYSIARRLDGPVIDDKRLGLMAYLAGWMTRHEVGKCLALQRELAGSAPPAPKFGEAAVEMGFLTEERVHALLHVQVIHRPSAYDALFGTIALRNGYVTQEQVDGCLQAQADMLESEHEAPFIGLLMVERNLLTSKQVKEILHVQKRRGEGPLPDVEREADGEPEAPAPAMPDWLRNKPLWLSAAAAVLLLLAGIGFATGGFGLYEEPAPTGVAGCTKCGAIIAGALGQSSRCSDCGAKQALAPIVKCDRCGHAYLLGAFAEGTKCPKCGKKTWQALTSAEEARSNWRPPEAAD